MKKVTFFCLFIFAFQFSGMTQSGKIQKPDCDTSAFKISSAAAADTAMKYIYSYDFQRVDSIKAVMENNTCVWKITTRGVATVHHGYYSTKYQYIYVDAMTGVIVKRGGRKVLGGKVPDKD